MMNNIIEINNTCKEVITFLSFFESDIINKIPNKVLIKLNEFAADSPNDYYVDMKKDLICQNITEEAKDLIALLYYEYILNENEKNELLKVWKKNQGNYQNELNKKYNLDKILKKTDKQEYASIKKAEDNSNTSLIEYKETFFIKFKNFLNKVLKKKLK